MTSITFAEDAWEEYLEWQIQDKKTLKKINTLLKEVQRTPFEGTSKANGADELTIKID